MGLTVRGLLPSSTILHLNPVMYQCCPLIVTRSRTTYLTLLSGYPFVKPQLKLMDLKNPSTSAQEVKGFVFLIYRSCLSVVLSSYLLSL